MLLFAVFEDVTTFFVVVLKRTGRTVAGESAVLFCGERGAAAAVCGAAIEVLFQVSVAPSIVDEVMPTPEANQSTQLP